jgi:hypothetical protein
VKQPVGLVAQQRAIEPARLCKIHWPDGQIRDGLEAEDISGATVERVSVDNVSHLSQSVATQRSRRQQTRTFGIPISLTWQALG